MLLRSDTEGWSLVTTMKTDELFNTNKPQDDESNCPWQAQFMIWK